jgi:hypothetical protein
MRSSLVELSPEDGSCSDVKCMAEAIQITLEESASTVTFPAGHPTRGGYVYGRDETGVAVALVPWYCLQP